MKKILITAFCVLSSLFVFAYHKSQLNAAPVSHPYYNVGDAFERTSSSSFIMGGLEWTIVNTDPINQKAYILSKNLSYYAGCGGRDVYPSGVDSCTATANSLYAADTTNDDMGEYVERINGKGTLVVPDAEFYNKMTVNETYFAGLDRVSEFYHFWVDEFSGSRRIAYSSYSYSGSPFSKDGITYNRLFVFTDPSCGIMAGQEIDLPQKGIIKTISSDNMSITLQTTDSKNGANQTIANISTTEGDGPYHFYIYDTDARGSGTYTNASSYFTLNANEADGTAKVNIINKLPEGDYYFKVRVVDESVNNKLYYDADDFTKDP